MKILLAAEMIGTVNALGRSLKLLSDDGHDIIYAAADAALKFLADKGHEPFTLEDAPDDVINRADPEVVMIGATAALPGSPKWSGLEWNLAIEALESRIQTVVYRDYFGITQTMRSLSAHRNAADCLNFFMFDEATAAVLRKLPSRSVQVVGSGYYDDLGTMDWAAERAAARAAMSIAPDDFVLYFNPGAERERVLEVLKPTVNALKEVGRRLVFVTSFHPKDPDAPFAPDPAKKGQWIARPSVYDAPLDDLEREKQVTIIREPWFRNVVPDSQKRLAVADFVVMNPLSTDLITATYAGIPFILTNLPTTTEEARGKDINVWGLDVVEKRMALAADSTTNLHDQLVTVIGDYARVTDPLRARMKNLKPEPAAPRIAEAIAGLKT